MLSPEGGVGGWTCGAFDFDKKMLSNAQLWGNKHQSNVIKKVGLVHLNIAFLNVLII